MALIYLAGPITGLRYGEAMDFRMKAEQFLKEHGHRGLSPLRYKTYLEHKDTLADAYNEFALSTAKAIVTRDRWDVMRSDAVLFNFLGAKQVSIGSVIEIGWADAFRKPAVLVMEEDSCHKHAMLTELCSFRAKTLDEGLDLIVSLL